MNYTSYINYVWSSSRMGEILFDGIVGKIHGILNINNQKNAPAVLILPPHPKYGGNIDKKLIYRIQKIFVNQGFTALRINYRGIGKSSGVWDNLDGELNDAAVALDWLEAHYPTASQFWVLGFSFGTWIGMQLLMRRPEIERFISISPPVHMYDFSFLSPCPVSGIVIHGTEDKIVPIYNVNLLMSKMRIKEGVVVEYKTIEEANHLFENKEYLLEETIKNYIMKIRSSQLKKMEVIA